MKQGKEFIGGDKLSPPQSSGRRQPVVANWRMVKLGEICERIDYGFTASADFSAEEPRFLRITDIQNGRVEWGLVPGCRISAAETEHYQLRDGDIVFARTGATTGKSFLIQSPPKAVFASYLIRMRLKEECDPAFVSFFLQGEDYWRQIRSQARGGAQPNFNATILSALQLRLPNQREQGRIAAHLREQMAEVERARAAVQAQLDAAQILPAALLRAVFNSPTAQRWPRRRLGDSLVLRKEIVHPSDNPKGPATFVGLEHIESQTGKRVGGVEVEMADLTGRKPRFRTGDIVYGYLRPYLNKVWVADFDGLCSVDQYAYAVRAEVADTLFVAWFLRSPTYLERAPINTTPGQLPRIRLEEVAAVQIGLPLLGEQRNVAGRIEAEFKTFNQLRQSLETRLEEIELLPAALLRSAFSGE